MGSILAIIIIRKVNCYVSAKWKSYMKMPQFTEFQSIANKVRIIPKYS